MKPTPHSPFCHLIAGPNGAGKSTFALEHLPALAKCTEFVNADLIAAGLSPLDPTRSAAYSACSVEHRVGHASAAASKIFHLTP
jgi:predicted ABC-type ATPase